MNNRVAIDVAMFLPPEIEEQAMALNRDLIKGQPNPPVVLDKNPCLPHASLLMAGIEREDIGAISEKLGRLVASVMPFDVKIIGSYHMGTEEDSSFSGLELEGNERLQKLHEGVVEIVRPFKLDGITKDMFTEGSETDDFIPPYVETFFDTQCGKKYWPHITVGHGPLPEVEPRTFTASRVEICHLGNWGTCRKVLG